MIARFNIRVYGILRHNDNVLLVHESIPGMEFTKFPGGGLEFGEGIHDCLMREFKEETGLDIQILRHIYTTDFFQQSAFSREDQIISIYYEVFSNQPIPSHGTTRYVNVSTREEKLTFLHIPIYQLTTDLFTFPIDKHVCNLYINQFIQS
jgi:8-oxo-dGTP diphosphatase